MVDTISVATSIAPEDIENQRRALASWSRLGFKIISVNNPEEILIVKKHFPEVSFIEASRNAKELTEKPYIFFDDILKALESTKTDICGIVNSDIYLITSDKFSEFIASEAKNCLIYGSRTEVESIDSLIGEEYRWGMDYFFFDKSIIPIFPNSNFSLGAPWWDLWACFIPTMKGFCVKNLVTHIAYHITHQQRWSPQVWVAYCEEFISHCLFNKLSDMSKHFLGNTNSFISEKKYKELAIYVSIFIDKNSTKISLGDTDFLHGDRVVNFLIRKFIETEDKFIEAEKDRAARLEIINKQHEEFAQKLDACEKDRTARLNVINKQAEDIGKLQGRIQMVELAYYELMKKIKPQ
jgi:hypothetical protein